MWVRRMAASPSTAERLDDDSQRGLVPIADIPGMTNELLMSTDRRLAIKAADLAGSLGRLLEH
jgi:hypothetical protein